MRLDALRDRPEHSAASSQRPAETFAQQQAQNAGQYQGQYGGASPNGTPQGYGPQGTGVARPMAVDPARPAQAYGQTSGQRQVPQAKPDPMQQEPQHGRAPQSRNGGRGKQDDTLSMDEAPQRRGCLGMGCSLVLWAIFLTIVGGIGLGVWHWKTLDDKGRQELVRNIYTDLKGAPLEFIRSTVSQFFDREIAPPPINQSGDNGVITPRTPEPTPAQGGMGEAPAQNGGAPAPIPWPSQQAPAVLPGQTPGQVPGQIAGQLPGQIPGQPPEQGLLPGANPEGPLPGEPETVSDPALVEVPEAYLSSPVVRDVASRAMHSSQFGQAERGLTQSVLKYAFTSSVASDGRTFAGAVAKSVAGMSGDVATASRLLAEESAKAASVLTAMSQMPDIAARLNSIEALRAKENSASAGVEFVTEELSRFRSQGASGADLRATEQRLDAMSARYSSAAQSRRLAEAQLAEDLRRLGGSALSDEQILSLTRRAARASQGGSAGSVEAGAEALRELSRQAEAQSQSAATPSGGR